jgi:hypothetical protein
MPKYLRANIAVRGQAATPENRANQPFVRGSGPRVRRSTKPPPPATSAHTQAATKPNAATHVLETTGFLSGGPS